MKLFVTFFIALCVLPVAVFATTTPDDLQSKIDERNNQIKELELQLNQYNAQVDVVSKQAQNLQSTIKTLNLTQSKLSVDLSLTTKKIDKTNLTIQSLGDQIDTAKQHIQTNTDAIARAFQNIQINEDNSILNMVLSGKNFEEVWSDLEATKDIQQQIRANSAELTTLKADLEAKQNETQTQQKTLVQLKQDLNGKNQVIQYTKAEKAKLLADTKNQEKTYEQLIQTTQQKKAQFEQDVFNFESQLKLTIDQNGYPSPQRGILSWPLDNVFITQLFGKTVGAEKLYVSGSHNGVDFRASVGTRVKNVLAGVVAGTGNTDAYAGCYSFGKWVMIKHDNGLSTIYGHLSVISVSTGQRLDTGDLIGYSGNTGYSTGPHLHISVYATQGVRIEKFVNSIGCKQAVLPLADIKAYLDPMAYFPSYP